MSRRKRKAQAESEGLSDSDPYCCVTRGTNGLTLRAGDNAKKTKSEGQEEAVEENPRRPVDPEREKRTVFVGNVPVNVKKPDMKKLFKTYGDIESIRFRSVVRKRLYQRMHIFVAIKSGKQQGAVVMATHMRCRRCRTPRYRKRWGTSRRSSTPSGRP